MRGFGEILFKASDVDGSHSTFTFGEVVLFFTSDLTDRITVLNETTFKPGGNIGVERIVAKYSWDVRANLEAGKFHTPISYWNDTFHHGRVFWPTIERPSLFSRGIIPIHTNGVMLRGTEVGSARLGYDLLIGNGATASATADDNEAKSVALALTSEAIDNLNVGAALYWDRFPAGSRNKLGDPLPRDMDQLLLSGKFIYLAPDVELMAEYFRVTNDSGGPDESTSNSFYVYGGYRSGKQVTYVRYDRLSFEPTEPFYKPTDENAFLLGFRYEFSYISVLKFEYQTVRPDQADTVNRFAVQIAVGF
jgi:hypothetical protein